MPVYKCTDCAQTFSPDSSFCLNCGGPPKTNQALLIECRTCKSLIAETTIHCVKCGETDPFDRDEFNFIVDPNERSTPKFLTYLAFGLSWLSLSISALISFAVLGLCIFLIYLAL